MKDEINRAISLTKFKGIIKVVVAKKFAEEPHPFCITDKHIKRYYLDVQAGPCGMRVHPDDPTIYAGKRMNKEGITGTCGLTFEEHTYKVQILIELQQDLKAQLLEDSLQQGMEMEVIFDKFHIQGFAFVVSDPQFTMVE